MLAQDDYMPGLTEAVFEKRLTAAGLVLANRLPTAQLPDDACSAWNPRPRAPCRTPSGAVMQCGCRLNSIPTGRWAEKRQVTDRFRGGIRGELDAKGISRVDPGSGGRDVVGGSARRRPAALR